MNDSRKELTRRRIILAACETIADSGFEGVRMRMVAERAEVSTALLHYHFDTREKLFLEALRFSFEHAGADEYSAAPPEKGPHTWLLARVIDSCLPRTRELRRDFMLWQELWLRAARDEESRVLAVDLYRQMREWIGSTIAKGVEAGEFTACDIPQVAERVLVLTDGYGIRLLLDESPQALSGVRSAIWAAISPDLGMTEPFPES